MTVRVVMGQHPTGPYGLFVSRPGWDAMGTDPNSRSGWKFSSQWNSMANIVQGGTGTTGQNIAFPQLGYIPIIFWEIIASTGTDTYTAYQQPSRTSSIFEGNTTYNVAYSIYKIFNPRNEPYFRLDYVNNAQYANGAYFDGRPVNAFKYTVFALKAGDYY